MTPVLAHIVQHTSTQFFQKQVIYFSKIQSLDKISDLRHLTVIDTSVTGSDQQVAAKHQLQL